MRLSRRNIVNPSGNNEHNYQWDLNEPEFQKRLENYLLHGVPGSDARGHNIKLEARFSPIQGNIIESIRSKLPSNMWRSNSEAIRSLLSLGCCVALKMLSLPSEAMAEYFRVLELLNVVNKSKDESTLYGEVQKAVYEMNSVDKTDMAAKVKELENCLVKKGKVKA